MITCRTMMGDRSIEIETKCWDAVTVNMKKLGPGPSGENGQVLKNRENQESHFSLSTRLQLAN